MSITNIVRKNKDALQFEWNDPQQPIIHALQRIMISDVPTLAIDMIMVDENTSILADPELALRLGLIPMESSLADSFLFPDECECENFCHKCSIRM